MIIPRYNLDIEITLPQIGVRSENAQVEIQMEPSAASRQFHPPEWHAVERNAFVEIDNSAWRAEFDIETPVLFTEKIVAEGRSELEQENAWRARNGDLCYRARPGDKTPVIDFAMHYFNVQDAKVEFNVDYTPHARPIITGHVDPMQKLQFEPWSAAAFGYRITATPPSVEIYLAVQPSIRMHAEAIYDERV